MSRDQLFNAANSEYVSQQQPNQDGEFFRLLHGAGPNALPATLGTSQGNSNPNYDTNAPHDGPGNGLVPHGTLVRNPNIVSLLDEVTNTQVVNYSTVNGTTVLTSDSFANINIAFNSYTGTFAQAVPAVGNGAGAVGGIVVTNIYSTNSTGSPSFPKSTVNPSGAGWIQSGNNIVWANGTYPSFSGAAVALDIPASGATYYVAITYNETIVGQLMPGYVAGLSVPQSVENAWIGNNVFGKSTYGSPEVQILDYSSTRDTYSIGSNTNPIVVPSGTYAPNAQESASDIIPSVGTRFYRG